MQSITSPIHHEETSSAVANLQAALNIMLPAIGFTEFAIAEKEIAMQQALGSTIEAIKILRDKFPNKYNEELLVDALMAKLINDFMQQWFVIKGRVTNAAQQGLAEHVVIINEYDIDEVLGIGKATTNSDGAFEFGFLYNTNFQDKDGATQPDIHFQVIAVSGEALATDAVFIIMNDTETLVEQLAKTPKAPRVLMNMANEISVRIVPHLQEAVLTPFEKLVAQLTPFMGNKIFAELKEDEGNFQISFLHKETGIAKASIEILRNAFVQEQESGLPAWAFFGLAIVPLPITEWNSTALDVFIKMLEDCKPKTSEENTKALAEKLLAYAKEKTVESAVANYTITTGALLQPILQSEEKLQQFLQAYAMHEGSTEDFWKAMEQNTLFSQDVPKIQLSLQLHELTMGNIGLIQSLQENGISETKQLVQLSREAWQEMAMLHPDAIPHHIIADTDNERAGIYAGELQTLVELAFPTETIKKFTKTEGVLQFLEKHPDFDFTSTPVEAFLQAKGTEVFQDINNQELVLNELRETQRLYAITASASDAKLLTELGMTSAKSIANLTANDFVTLSEGKFSTDQAMLYHTKASSITEASAMLYMQLKELSDPQQAMAIGGGNALATEDPTLRNLFGSLETCECQHCRSVYSPAAYFVDLLHVLLGQNNGMARKEIFRRRPDLQYTKLSCEHTDTLIPYIDLVNELLETYVAQDDVGNAAADAHALVNTNDTSAFSKEELAANPQHDNAVIQADADVAYKKISEASYPLTLPFDLNVETARQFLLAQNSSLYQLKKTFGDANAVATIAESIGLTDMEYRILVGKNNLGNDWKVAEELYGYDTLLNTLGDTLKPVKEFIAKTDITYTDLMALVETNFLNANKNIVLVLEAPTNPAPSNLELWEAANACNVEFIKLVHKDLTALDEIELALFNRFIRLLKKMGCSIQELDLLLSALGNTFTPALLQDFATLWQLKQEYALSAEQAVVLVNNIPSVAQKNSYYEKLFLNKTILQIDDKFILNATRNELVHQAEKLADHKLAILAAFQISEQDLNEIAQLKGIVLTNPNTLTLANLSAINRFVLIAHINRLSVHDLFLWMPFAPVALPTNIAHVASNQVFFDTVKRHGLNATTMAYIFNNVTTNAQAPKIEIIQKAAKDLRDGFIKINETTTPNGNTITQDFLKLQLGSFFEEKEMDKMMSILNGSIIEKELDFKKLPAIDENNLTAIDAKDILYLGNPPTLAAYAKVFENYLVGVDLKSNITVTERYQLFWKAFSKKSIPHLKETFAKQQLISQFKTDADIIAFLFEDIKTAIFEIEEDTIPHFDQFSVAYIQVFKLLWLTNALKLSANELQYFQTNTSDFENFDWKNFTIVQFKSWLQVADYISLRNSIPIAEKNLISIFEEAKIGNNVSNIITEVTGFDAKNVAHFVSTLAIIDFKNANKLLLLQKQIVLSEKIQVSVEQLGKWATIPIDAALAQDIKKALKIIYDNEAWVAVSEKVHNQLRNKQRDALLAFILQKPEIKNKKIKEVNEIYAYFLIDVEMDACMKTSRLVQSIASVQLFVQRCFLNIEKVVSPSAIDKAQWAWMKNYRVWEANRKVFLYAENWIEPELRDNKSPFFKELESELQQAEVTSETAEKAITNYLYKLDEVARLDICGMYENKEGHEMHVFGRTFNNPAQYYYRKQDMVTHEWTAWDKIQVDIQGNDEGDNAGVHLIPVVWNRRLYLFWPMFTEKPKEQTEKEKKLGSEPKKYWQIKMAFSEYNQNRWMPKKVSKTYINTLAYESLSSYKWHVINSVDFRILLHGEQHEPYFHFKNGGELVVSTNDSTFVDIFMIKQYNEYQKLADEGIIMVYPELFKEFSIAKRDVQNYGKFEVLKKSGDFSILHSSNYDFSTNFSTIFLYLDKNRNYYVTPHQSFYLHALPAIVDKSKISISKFSSEIKLNQTLQNNLVSPKNNFAVKFEDKEIDQLFNLQQINANTVLQLKVSNENIALVSKTEQVYDSFANKLSNKYFNHNFRTQLQFEPFFHAYIDDFIKAINTKGIEGLLSLLSQTKTDTYRLFGGINLNNNFKDNYSPHPTNVSTPYPIEDVDFSSTGAYSMYNWELFFHIPMLLANRLCKNQQFEEAMRWYHFIFDPTTNDVESTAKRYWQILPLRNNDAKLSIESLLQQLNLPDGNNNKAALEKAIAAWRKDPFNPHLIARMRLVAYQKNVLMKYIDNLIAWADNLFQQDSLESINEATQLYILAANLLGNRPEKVPLLIKEKQSAENYKDLETAGLNAFSNALVKMETMFPFFNTQPVAGGVGNITPIISTSISINYFGIPVNTKLLGYWDTVADRLFKIRHCQNIAGVERELALFQPEIDPALLVLARAKGFDISSILADLNAPLPHYRFGYIIQKCLEICAELKSLGNMMLSLLEKKDNEALSLMRVQQEVSLMNLTKTVKKLQIKESQKNREGLEKTQETTEHRVTFYKILLENGLNSGEEEQQELSALSMVFSIGGQYMEMASSAVIASLPDVTTGTSGISPVVQAEIIGGKKIGGALSAFGRYLNMYSSMTSFLASQAQTNAGYQRRADEWKQQKELAEKELKQIDKQILAAQIRESIAEQELVSHEKQMDNSRQVEEYYKNKFTQEELYGWMQGEIATIYFQCYQLAYDLAKKAEKTYRYELGIPVSNFIQFGVWDSFRKGLMSGERLYLSLKQMEKAYMDQNRREYELTKHISLLQHFPMALLQLKATGTCIVEIPEELLDADYPGQYMRRIKSMSISIPCVVGPYTSINCTLSLLKSETRIKNTLAGLSYKKVDNSDDRFITQFGAIQSIATSQAQNDSGMFELNFRDERYLPFEYAGAISRWKIELPLDTNSFDFSSLSDIILHTKYTAREGGKILKNAAQKSLPKATELLLTVKHHFANEWYQYTQLNKGKTLAEMKKNPLKVTLTPEHLPFFAKQSAIDNTTPNKAYVFLKSGINVNFKKDPLNIELNGKELTIKLTQLIVDIDDVFFVLRMVKN